MTKRVVPITDITFSFDPSQPAGGEFSGRIQLKETKSNSSIRDLANEIAEYIPVLAIYRATTSWGNNQNKLTMEAAKPIARKLLESVDIQNAIIIDNIFAKGNIDMVYKDQSFMDRFSDTNRNNIENLIIAIAEKLCEIFDSEYTIHMLKNRLIEHSLQKDGVISQTYAENIENPSREENNE